MKRFTLVLGISLLMSTAAVAQLTQTITGRVIDADSKEGLAAATVLVESAEGLGATTDEMGYYVINEVPIGRHTISAEYVGYEPVVRNNIMVTSGKEVNLDIDMVE